MIECSESDQVQQVKPLLVDDVVSIVRATPGVKCLLIADSAFFALKTAGSSFS